MRAFVQHLPVGVFLVAIGACLVVAAVLATAGIHARRRASLIATTRVSAIGPAHDGYREFAGTAEAVDGQTVTAPLTGSPCVWYSARVEHWQRPLTAARHDWCVVRMVTSSAPFLVRDATGVCAVYPQGAEVTPTEASQWTGATPEPPERQSLRTRPAAPSPGSGPPADGPEHPYRYREERICAGDPVLVLGRFTGGHGSWAGDAASASAVVDPDDDITLPVEPDADAWQAADDEMAERLSALAEATTAVELATGGSDEPLVIAAMPHGEDVSGRRRYGTMALGAAIVPLGLAVVIAWLRVG